jgi:cation channel sperm-associated protein 4
MIMNTILESLPDLFYIGILIVIAMFIWGIVGVVLFSSFMPDFFGNTGLSMFTLYVVLTGDGWVEIHEQLSVYPFIVYLRNSASTSHPFFSLDPF